MTQRDSEDIFIDPQKADVLLNDLIEPLIGSFDEHGRNYSAEELRHTFIDALRKSPNPDKSLLNLHRIEDVSFGTSLLRDIVRHPFLRELIVTITGHSQFLSDILVKDPELFRWLTTSDVLGKTKSRDQYAAELRDQTGLFSKFETRLNAVRRYHRREMLRVGVREILRIHPFETIIGEISDLADAVSHVVYEMAVERVKEKFGWRPTTPFVIIGLGKLGGRELNYSSDIDVMFVMGDDESHVLPNGKEIHALDFYTTTADQWITAMTEFSTEGSLYRVDARLRPDGARGPLVRTVQGYHIYYETRGELWERQMLIKARPIAGDLQFGSSFIESLQPFVYPHTLFESPRKTIARMKARIERKCTDPNNIKLCRGGIRDIEFIVQALQLLNGGRNPTVRCNSTLTAIERLTQENLLSQSEASALTETYIFYRTLEHRVQLDQNIQTHSLPSEVGERLVFAKKTGFSTVEEFEAKVHDCLATVQRIFSDVFESDQMSDTISFEVLRLDDEIFETTVIEQYGFRNPKRTRELLERLAYGVSNEGVGQHDARTIESIRLIAPQLLHDFVQAVDPDRALVNFLSIIQSHPYPHALFEAFRNNAIRRGIVRLCGMSNRFPLLLKKNQAYMEMIVANADEIFTPERMFSDDIGTEHDLFLVLLAHLRYVNNACTLEDLHFLLSRLAKFRIETTIRDLLEYHEMGSTNLAIITLGKLSGDELGPDADLDLVFLYEKTSESDAVLMARLVQDFIQRCSGGSDNTLSYNIDIRLRPEGQRGALALDLESYTSYLRKRASLWERQSLVRANVMSSSPQLREKAEKILFSYVYDNPLPSLWIDEIREMRYRTEKRSRMNRNEYVDFKSGPGGILDIEFLVQTMQLHFGRQDETVRTASTIKALEILGRRVPDFQVWMKQLTEAYRLYRKLEYFNRIYREDPSNLVPTEENDLEALQRFLAISEDPLERTGHVRARVRHIFESAMDHLKSVVLL